MTELAPKGVCVCVCVCVGIGGKNDAFFMDVHWLRVVPS